MKGAVKENKQKILDNKQSIRENKKTIQENKSAINELKCNHVPYVVFESAIAKYDKIVHRLILALCIVVALLFISNAVWLYSWGANDLGRTTYINKDNVSNVIGHDGKILEEKE